MKYEIYRDRKSEWRWRFKAGNGNIIATASEGYLSKGDRQHSIVLVQTSADFPVVEVEK